MKQGADLMPVVMFGVLLVLGALAACEEGRETATSERQRPLESAVDLAAPTIPDPPNEELENPENLRRIDDVEKLVFLVEEFDEPIEVKPDGELPFFFRSTQTAPLYSFGLRLLVRTERGRLTEETQFRDVQAREFRLPISMRDLGVEEKPMNVSGSLIAAGFLAYLGRGPHKSWGVDMRFHWTGNSWLFYTQKYADEHLDGGALSMRAREIRTAKSKATGFPRSAVEVNLSDFGGD